MSDPTPTPPAEVDVAEGELWRIDENHPVIAAIIELRLKRVHEDNQAPYVSVEASARRSSRFEAADTAIVECAEAVKPALLAALRRERTAAEQVASLRGALQKAPLPSMSGSAAEFYQRFFDWLKNDVEPALERSALGAAP